MSSQRLPQGFTLLEVMIALALLVMVFGGVTSIIILTNEAQRSAKNTMIASYLADEALELLRYKRDLNYILDATPFNTIATETDSTAYSFIISYDGTVESPGVSDVTQTPVLNVSTFYTQSLATDQSYFRRLITTTYHDAAGPLPARIDIVIEVYWKSDTKSDTYTLTGELFDIE